MALWHIPAGSVPELDDAVRRVDFLERHGPSPYAFGKTPEVLIFEITTSDDPQTLNLVSRLMFKSMSRLAEGGEWGGLLIRARVNGALVGCGAIRPIDMTIGEIGFVLVDDTVDLRAAFLDATGFDSWQSTSTPWSRRGVERAADAIAHGLLSAPLPVAADGGNGCDREFARFELLMGLRAPRLDRP